MCMAWHIPKSKWHFLRPEKSKDKEFPFQILQSRWITSSVLQKVTNHKVNPHCISTNDQQQWDNAHTLKLFKKVD